MVMDIKQKGGARCFSFSSFFRLLRSPNLATLLHPVEFNSPLHRRSTFGARGGSRSPESAKSSGEENGGRDGTAGCCLSDIAAKADTLQLDEEPMKRHDPDAEPPSANGCFDCNICLEFATEPVVTLCGHLYCWPCVYKWLQIKNSTSRWCPVCKASLSQDLLVPLYGRGGRNANGDKSPEIPRRPASVYHAEEYEDQEYQYQRHSSYSNGGYPSPLWLMEMRVIQSTAGGVLEGLAGTILPWMFRNHESVYYSRPHFPTAGARNPRLRRQEVQAERMLHQFLSFLFCCAMLCLLMF